MAVIYVAAFAVAAVAVWVIWALIDANRQPPSRRRGGYWDHP